MKLRVSVIPFIIFGLFGYSVHTANVVTDHGKKNLSGKAFVEQVKKDLSKIKPNNTVKYNP